jgi:hypothetical protein
LRRKERRGWRREKRSYYLNLCKIEYIPNSYYFNVKDVKEKFC